MNKKLSNGVEIPNLGLGTWKLAKQDTAETVAKAIEIGYRHIDTAAAYQNETEVGRGIAQSGIRRQDLFITTKLWNADQGYESTLHAFDVSLRKLGVEYLDLYLIHWPKAKSLESWRAMEQLYKQGRVRAIGVSNFSIEYLNMIFAEASINPMVNQVERHPYYQQNELKAFCDRHAVALEAYTPLAQGEVFHDDVLSAIAAAHQRSVAQIVLAWELQTGYITFPKSTHAKRLAENFACQGIVLSESELAQIAALDRHEKFGALPEDTFVYNKF